jgi:hypothetical protein
MSECPSAVKSKRWLRCGLAAGALLALWGCGAGLTQAQRADLQRQLRDAMRTQIGTRAQRDDNSRLLAHVVDQGALHGLDQEQVRAALGRGEACRSPLCEQHGFLESDWYYEIGHAQGPDVKQLPVLIVGFDPQGRAARVWTLTTH